MWITRLRDPCHYRGATIARKRQHCTQQPRCYDEHTKEVTETKQITKENNFHHIYKTIRGNHNYNNHTRKEINSTRQAF